MGQRRGVGAGVDWDAFADAWRARYQPQMETVRSGARAWVDLDVLHREALDEVVAEFGVDATFGGADRDELTRAWHRLDPWPDTVPGLTRLRARYVVAPNSNGHVALMVELPSARAAVGRDPRGRDRRRLQTAAGGLPAQRRAAGPGASAR